MKVTTQAPTVYPVFVPTEMNLHTYNFYLVETDGKLLLIDAGIDTDECWDLFQEVMAEQGFTIQDIDAIILTHHHEDHIGLVNRIRQIKDIPLYAHEKGISRLRRDSFLLKKRIRLLEDTFDEMGCAEEADVEVARLEKARVDNASQALIGEILPLREGDIIFGFDVVETPGHAVDHIMLYHPTSKVAFVGDQFIEHSSTNALVDIDESGNRSMSLVIYEKSLRHLLHVPMSIAYSGHGNIMAAPHAVIEKHLQRIERKSDRIIDLLRKEKTVAILAQEMYGEKYESLFALVMSDLIGHIDRLEYLGKIEKTNKNGVYYYRRK